MGVDVGEECFPRDVVQVERVVPSVSGAGFARRPHDGIETLRRIGEVRNDRRQRDVDLDTRGGKRGYGPQLRANVCSASTSRTISGERVMIPAGVS